MVRGSNPGRENYLLYEIYRPDLGQVGNRWFFFSMRIKRQERQNGHSPLLGAENKNECNYTSIVPYNFIPWTRTNSGVIWTWDVKIKVEIWHHGQFQGHSVIVKHTTKRENKWHVIFSVRKCFSFCYMHCWLLYFVAKACLSSECYCTGVKYSDTSANEWPC